MKDYNRQGRRKKPREDATELKLVGIDFNVGPDAHDRLRRLFTILLRHAARRKLAEQIDAPSDATPMEGHDGEEA